MALLGLIPEPPFDPSSWSGSSANFFTALRDQGLLAEAREVSISRAREDLEKAVAFALPMARWKARYHASVRRLRALTEAASEIIAAHSEIQGVLQIGAWFSSGQVTKLPCFSYHDGNAALRYRYYGRGLLSARAQCAHLDWERSVYGALTGIFVMSQWLADSFVEDFGVPRAKVHVVGGAINMKLPECVPAPSGVQPRYLFVGKDFERKGGKILLDAFRRVRQALPEAELIIVGPALQVQQAGVVCAGYLSKANPGQSARLAQLFSSASAVVLPSIYEPFGISLLEGMAFARPCIAVDRCAMPEIVRHGETGLIARAQDPAALADAMIELGRNPDEAARMGEAGRARIEAYYTWDAVSSKIKAVLATTYGI